MPQKQNTAVVTTSQAAVTPTAQLAAIGEIANGHARAGAFDDYLSRKADNTLRRQRADLQRFADFLAHVGVTAGDLQHDADAWQGITHGLVEGFRNWMIQQGDAVGSVNVRLSTMKTYAKLATKAGAIDPAEHAMIRLVTGYAHKEAKRVDERRETTRRGCKKAQHTSISDDQARSLKRQSDTPQGRRDALLMCLLLDHGLRCGEVAGLQVSDFDLKTGEMRFYRPKVDKVQTHKLSADTLRVVRAWFDSGHAPPAGPLLRGSRKGGTLTDAGMSARAITRRVRDLGADVGLFVEREHTTQGGKVKAVKHGTLSAHDCRHYWATFWAGKVDVLRLQEAGGWNSMAMPRRYVEHAKIANEGMA
ncbi:MAG: site-specific integrase [Anaerolineae bacterium]|nr:site-specific integrase [Anaerolineae bacterium]